MELVDGTVIIVTVWSFSDPAAVTSTSYRCAISMIWTKPTTEIFVFVQDVLDFERKCIKIVACPTPTWIWEGEILFSEPVRNGLCWHFVSQTSPSPAVDYPAVLSFFRAFFCELIVLLTKSLERWKSSFKFLGQKLETPHHLCSFQSILQQVVEITE